MHYFRLRLRIDLRFAPEPEMHYFRLRLRIDLRFAPELSWLSKVGKLNFWRLRCKIAFAGGLRQNLQFPISGLQEKNVLV